MNTDHLAALEIGLSHERARLAKATKVGEIELRKIWVAQAEREIAAERAFLGLPDVAKCEISDDDLMRQLLA
jgi:hypothetical protein